MNILREVVYKTLVDNLGVQANLLSRIEGDEPIGIELKGGEEIFIQLQDQVIQTFVEIPIADQRIFRMKSQKMMDVLCADETIFMNVRREKLIIISELSAHEANVERSLAEKLQIFNHIIHEIKS